MGINIGLVERVGKEFKDVEEWDTLRHSYDDEFASYLIWDAQCKIEVTFDDAGFNDDYGYKPVDIKSAIQWVDDKLPVELTFSKNRLKWALNQMQTRDLYFEFSY